MYSSLTGNTQKIALSIADAFQRQGIDVGIYHLEAITEPLDSVIEEADCIGLGYWVDKGTANKAILSLASQIKSKHVYLFGTLGALPDSEHAASCKTKVAEAFSENTVLGHFLCQGSISPKIIDMFRSLPKDHPHALTEDKLQRYRAAESKPDEDDFHAASAFSEAILNMVNAL